MHTWTPGLSIQWPLRASLLCRPMCFKSSKIAPSGPNANPRLRPASRGLMGVVSLLWRHLATTYRPPPRTNPVCGTKTQNQVQRNIAGLQEEAESLRRRRLHTSPAQERCPDVPLPCLTQCVLANNTLELPLILSYTSSDLRKTVSTRSERRGPRRERSFRSRARVGTRRVR